MRMKADKMFERLGYTKDLKNTSKFTATYTCSREWGTESIEINHKNKDTGTGHQVICFQSVVNTDGFNNACGMNARVLKAALKKMRELGWIDIFGRDINK